MELTGVVAGLLAIAGAVVVLAGVVLHAWAAGHRNLLQAAGRWAGGLPGQLARFTGHDRQPPHRERPPGGSTGRCCSPWVAEGLAIPCRQAAGLRKLRTHGAVALRMPLYGRWWA